MYSSGKEEFYKESAPPTAPPVHGGYNQPPPPATGIPVSAPTYVYTDTVPAPPPQFQATNHGSWSTGLFDCFSDVSNCCLTFWCPCITFGQIAEIADKGSSSCGVSGALYALIAYVIGCPCFYSCFYRTRLRQQYNLQESPCHDCLVHFFCESCALCQEARELKLRGFDLSLGWHGNMEKQNGGGITMAPFAQPGMDR